MPFRLSQSGRGRVHTLMGLACVFLMLVITSVQAAHFCEVSPLSTEQQLRADIAFSGNNAACLICMSAHGAPLIAPALHVTPAFALPESVPIAAPAFISGQQSFALHVRPPPAL